MAQVLITGSSDAATALTDVLTAQGHTVLLLDPADVDTGLAGVEPGTIEHYVQMPVRVTIADDGPDSSVVHRVNAFLQQGLMERFRTAEAVLSVLHSEAVVLLVSGNSPLDGAAPDDDAARRSLLHVLAHAMRAEKAPARLRVRVVDTSAGPEALATAALTGDKITAAPRVRSQLEANLTYADWRVEVMGLVGTDF